MNPIDRLAEYFLRFPGIGRRQARRFVYHLLALEDAERAGFLKAAGELSEAVARCGSCRRFFYRNGRSVEGDRLCQICVDPARDCSLLMLVEKDADLDAIEKTGLYKGRYFLLGGTASILEENPDAAIPADPLSARIANEPPQEIILALSATSEGEHAARHIETLLAPLARKHGFALSTLGRGLSTGTELEYSDADTIASALSGRQMRK